MSLKDSTLRLADATDILSDRFRLELARFADVVAPLAEAVDKRFRGFLRKQRVPAKAQPSLLAITPGEVARMIAAGAPVQDFFERLAYNGRRLAKFNLSPGDVTAALSEYDALLDQRLGTQAPAGLGDIREQLRFSMALTLNNAFYQVRKAETDAFFELRAAEMESGDLDTLLGRSLEALMRYTRAAQAYIVLEDGPGRGWVCRTWAGGQKRPAPIHPASAQVRMLSRPRCVDCRKAASVALDTTWPSQFQSCWSVPMISRGRTVGVMQFAFPGHYEWMPREMELLTGAAEHCLLAAQRAQMIEDLASREQQIRRLGEHMLHVEEVERQRISRELHDEAGQSMLCIRLALEVLEENCSAEAVDLKPKLTSVREITEKTIEEIRRLIRALSPSVLERFGLASAVKQLIHQAHQVHPARIRLQLGRLEGLPQQTEIMVYRLVQECLNNITKHSAATAVNVFLSSADGLLRLHVEDNGVGFQLDQAFSRKNSFGLAGMRERVALLGGSFELESHPAGGLGRGSQGTKILIQLPIPKGTGEPDEFDPGEQETLTGASQA